MDAMLAIFYTLLLLVVIAMIWSVREQNARSQEILHDVAQMQRDVARFLGADRN